MKLKYIGTKEREVPGVGMYALEWEGEVSKEKGEVLLNTGLFQEIKDTKSQKATKEESGK